jgi:6-phosphogluconolactonase
MKAKRFALSAVTTFLIAGSLAACCGRGNFFPVGGGVTATLLYTIGDTDIGAFTVSSSTGAVTGVLGSPFSTGFSTTNSPCPDLAATDPLGKFLFVPDSCNDNIVVYSIASTGVLTPITGSPFASGTSNFDLQQPVVDPSGKFLYVSEDSGAQVLGFTIGTSGALTAIAGSPFAAGGSNEALTVSPDGKFLYAADGNTTGTITAYSINPTTGVLAPVTGSPFALTPVDTPKFMAIDRMGKFMYVTGPETDTVLALSVETTGALMNNVPGSPFAAGLNPQGIATSPTGDFVFVANNADMDTESTGNVSAYTINTSTGALTAVAGSPFAAGPNPKRLAVDPTGGFLYVSNEDSDNMTVFSINPTTGVLAQITGSPFVTNVGSEGITIAQQF